MNEEKPVASREKIKKKGLFAAIFTVVVVAPTLATVLGIFSNPDPDPNGNSKENPSATTEVASHEPEMFDNDSLASVASQTRPRSNLSLIHI